jgi:hypothetical protein
MATRLAWDNCRASQNISRCQSAGAVLERETGMRVFACMATPLFGRRADVVAIDAPS